MDFVNLIINQLIPINRILLSGDFMIGKHFEDIIYEYYLLKGYLCLRNVPGKSKVKGGRDEIDLIAIKFENNNLEEVVWIEVTTYLNHSKTLHDKFTAEKEKYIKDYLLKLYQIKVDKELVKKCYTMGSFLSLLKLIELSFKTRQKYDLLVKHSLALSLFWFLILIIINSLNK